MSTAIYDDVTNRILGALKAGIVPWRKPWHSEAKLPANGLTNRAYRGVNVLLLALSPYGDHRWVTLIQANQLGGHVKAGEKATPIVFWKNCDTEEVDDETGEVTRKRSFLLRTYQVFNIEQCTGISAAPLPENEVVPMPERIERAESLVRSMPDPPSISETGSSAWYRPSDDHVQIPPIQTFASADRFYGTLFHELGHSTGHEKRLNRKGVTATIQFGSGTYGHEELVAELTSAFCCAVASLDNSFIENSASYIDSWLNVIRAEHKMVVIAAAQAQKAADYIFGHASLT